MEPLKPEQKRLVLKITHRRNLQILRNANGCSRCDTPKILIGSLLHPQQRALVALMLNVRPE